MSGNPIVRNEIKETAWKAPWPARETAWLHTKGCILLGNIPAERRFQQVALVTAMKHLLLPLLLLAACLGVMAAPQGTRPPLSKDEVLDLLITSAPSKVVISTIKQYGIAFKPTPQVLEEFRKAGADKAVLAALREAWQEDTPKLLGDKEIRMMLAEDVPSENIVRAVLERGIDFQPTPGYFEVLRSDGAKDALIDTLRAIAPRPFSKGELLQMLTTRMDQDWIAQKVQVRGIDFGPDSEDLQALRNAGARAPLLETVRTAKRAKPFVAQTPPGPTLAPPLVEGKVATLICDSSDSDVPVFAVPNDLGRIVARLRCGEHVTFLGRVVAPPGVSKIQYAEGKEGFVSNSFLESSIATAADGVTAPIPIYKPDPQYTPEARHDRIEGVVSLWIVVDAQGNVSDALEKSEPLGEGLDKSAIDTVKTWRFNPATRDGVPVAVRVRVEVTFRFGPNGP
jgi:TonB family protein